MRELSLLAQALRALDERAEVTMHFWHHPESHYLYIMDELQHLVSRHARPEWPISELQNRFDRANSRLMSEFWSHTWSAHEVHFHKSFEEFCNCTFTCLTEIADCVESISKGTS